MMRGLIALSLGIAVGIFVFTGAAAFTDSMLAWGLIGAVAAGVVAVLVHRHPIVPLDETACSRALKIVAGVTTLVALVQVGRMAVFMIDPSQVSYSSVPTSDWELRHSCLSAYFVAGEAASAGHNIYDNSLYTMPDDDPRVPRKARMLGPFKIDVFEYPPQFLLLPRALHILTPDFMKFRMLWFALDGLVILLAILVVARFLGPTLGTRALLFSPLIWIAIPTASTLQKGNVQAMVIAAAMLAMVLFEKRRWPAGGALLAFVTVSKLYPGLLIVYLIARRQWRAVGWTIALAVVFSALTLLDMGWAAYAAFLDHLPGLLGGEAFPAFRNPVATAINFSIPGLAFKLKLFGVPGMSFATAKILGWIYTPIALLAVVFAGLRTVRDEEKPRIWLAIIILATLRSPFLPQAYAAFPPLWLLTLLAARYAPTPKTLAFVFLAWSALNIFWPMDWKIDPRLLAVVSGVPQVLTILLAVLALRVKPTPELVSAPSV